MGRGQAAGSGASPPRPRAVGSAGRHGGPALILYLDTSVLVKLYVLEKGTAAVRAAVRRADAVATSAIAYVEARAALGRRYREKVLGPRGHRRAVEALDADWPEYLRLQVREPLIRLAADVAEHYRLRAYDAVHLASALALRNRAESQITFACWDDDLRAGAQAADLDVWPLSRRAAR